MTAGRVHDKKIRVDVEIDDIETQIDKYTDTDILQDECMTRR